jgi:hypothetical protein
MLPPFLCSILNASILTRISYRSTFAAFPIVYQEQRGYNLVIGSLPFLSILIGILFASLVNIYNQSYYLRRFKANGGHAVPEARLPPMMLGSFFFSGGLFIFAWTSAPKYPWYASCLGVVAMGFGFFTIFQAALNYLVDTFLQVAASAIAANTFLRSILAAAFPLFANPMFHNLGTPWATSTLAFISVAMIPIPYLFFIFGERIRARGKWSNGSMSKNL